MENQRWNIDLLEILGEVGLRERLNAFISPPQPDLHGPEPERILDTLRHLRSRPVRAVKRSAELPIVLRAIAGYPGPDAIEHFNRQATGVGRRLQHQRRYRRHQRSYGDPSRPMPAGIARDFTAACQMANHSDALKIERLHQRREIIGVSVEVVSIPGLAGPAMATAIMRDAAETL